MPDSFDYTTGTNSENVRLLQALIDDAPEYTEETNSRNANILKSIINNTEYTDAPQSEIEELLLRLKAKIGGEIEVDELNVTENGTYDAGVNKAYNPVNVELPLDGKTITANGTYTASEDNLAGYDEVTVAVQGYAKKSIANTPTPIATFNASALPMPSLTVGIEAVQSGTGDPSPTNICPFSGWSAVNVYDTGKNLTTRESITSSSNGGLDANLRIGNAISGIQYTISADSLETNAKIIRVYIGSTEITNVASGAWTANNRNSVTFTAPISGEIGLGTNKETFSNSTKVLDNIQLELGDTATAYEPYNGTTYTTTLKDGQGNPMTCYGGELVNENGVQRLVNGRNDVDMGSQNWGYTNGRFYYNPTDAKVYEQTEVANLLCSHYSNSKYLGQADNSISSYAGYIYVRADSYNGDITAFKTAMNGAQLVYELATPQTIPQDNLPIATQDGTNNLWADSGDVQSGEYFVEL